MKNQGSIPIRGKKFFSSPESPHQLCGPPSLFLQWIPGDEGYSSQHRQLTTVLYLRLKLGMHGIVPPFPYIPSWGNV
jgi:hypothetical protein